MRELNPVVPEVINLKTNDLNVAVENILSELRHKYVIHLYQDGFGNWYASIKPENKPSTKVSVEFYLSYLMRKINLILHSMEYPET